MKILLVDNGTTLLEKLKALLPGEEVVHHFDALTPHEADEFDLVVLSGGSVYPVKGNEAKFATELELIRARTKALVGICLGCELLVEAFGGELKELPERDKGIKEIEILESSLFPKSTLKVYENHRWGIATLPPNFLTLAQSPQGPEIIKHPTLPMYGLQFHPENFVEETDGDDLFINLLSKLVAQLSE